MLRLAGLFDPAAREMIEMAYEFEEPYILDSSKIEQAFGLRPTPLEVAIGETVDWWRAQVAAGSRAA
jgi:nucleoside-diphosphate-sugar epimerase